MISDNDKTPSRLIIHVSTPRIGSCFDRNYWQLKPSFVTEHQPYKILPKGWEAEYV